jgi:hypothetical protein
VMALRSSLVRLARSDLLSKPAGAPVFSKDLTEAKARSKQFFRDVSATTQHRSAPPSSKPSPTPKRVSDHFHRSVEPGAARLNPIPSP